ncbi:hypothetical protein GJ744_004804 [Endocarpon pusillum]|uniref:Peptidase S8/S53 domain-containing protein n=1 Tax=Endocarpon pusillum TaxID=364733 RepID=A0A8H7A6B0_9EURO|nr:hypothetical protein GJ744_004804 [Endocarpon pusillum]
MNIPASHSSTSFACSVAQQLRDIARELAKETGTKAFCSALAAELANVQQHLGDLGEEPGKTAGESRLLKLLDNLERLCQWPARSSSPSCLGITFDRRRYPTLIRLIKTRQVVKKAIKDFASEPRAKRDRVSLLKLLKAFGKPKKVTPGSELSELEPVDTRQQQDDYQAYIRDLYASLASHCVCLREDGQKVITAHLRLNNCCTPGELADSINFRVFFLDHPHCYKADGTCQWQDTQICVMRKRAIKLKNEQDNDKDAHLGKVISMETFCKIITNRKRSQLKLDVSDDGLLLQGPGYLSQDFLLGTSSVSLAQLLDVAKLSRKMKLLLSYFLAKAVWQFYDSEWMQTEWTKETVHFMFERRSKIPKGIFINEPFLSARFHCQQRRSVDDEFRSHLFPKILSLGIMFLETELGIKIEDYRMPEDRGPDGEPTVNADHFAAMEVFNKSELWEEKDTFCAFIDVIGACLTPDHFKPFLNDVHGLRDAFEKHIVNPLQALYKTAWEDPDTSHVRAVELDSSSPSLPEATKTARHLSPLSPSSTPLPATPAYQTPYYSPATHLAAMMHAPSFCHPMQSAVFPSCTSLPDAITSTSNSGITSDDWFRELDKLKVVLRPKPKEKDGAYQPVKIAILDTGVKEDYADSVKGFKDFVSQDDDWQDNTGHGTNAVRLIQKVYNMAEIYVGRVFDGSRATDITATLMAEAVRHAKNSWKVDIIVMPSGFKSEDNEMENAIDEARNARILVFAAASNYGNFFNIAFPGRLYIDLKLFCMFSTDANARALLSFNPSPSSKARYNFAILGENIKLPSLETLLSGTSFATMIGGAIAGRILDFSRHKDNRERIRRIDKLHTVEGMSAVFETMVESAVDNRYHCISPWKILPLEFNGCEPTQKRLRERAHICETISRALEDMRRR